MPAATPLPRRASASGREAFPLTGEGVGRRSAARGAFGRRRLSAVRGLVVLLPTETGGSGRAGLRCPSLAPRSRAGAGEEGTAGGVSASREGRENEMHRRELQRSAACDGESRPGAALLAALTVSPRSAATALAASRKVHAAAEAGSSSRSRIVLRCARRRAGGFFMMLCLLACARCARAALALSLVVVCRDFKHKRHF